MIVTVTDPDGHEVRLPAPPIGLSGTPSGIRHAPPQLGADTVRVMSEWLGWSDERIERTRATGAFGRTTSEEQA